MSCNICGDKVSDDCPMCDVDLDKSEFYCHDPSAVLGESESPNAHLCSQGCLEKYVMAHYGQWEIAEDDEKERQDEQR